MPIAASGFAATRPCRLTLPPRIHCAKSGAREAELRWFATEIPCTYFLRHRTPPKVFPVTAEMLKIKADWLDRLRHAGRETGGWRAVLAKFDGSGWRSHNQRVATLRRVGLWRSWERASMAWKRSSVRSRSGPPNYPLKNQTLTRSSFPQGNYLLVSI